MTTKRNRRAGVEDLWHLKKPQPVLDEDGRPVLDKHGDPVTTDRSKLYGKGKRWRARYVDDQGEEHTQRFDRKADAQSWLDKATASLEQGTHVAPRDAQRTVQQWCDEWIKGYERHRGTTVDLARAHIKHIVAEFGDLPLSKVRPSAVKAWTAKLKTKGLEDSTKGLEDSTKGLEDSTIYALHSRLSQILGDAVHDGLLHRNPCSRRTSPPAGRQKVYVATTEQIWQLHDSMPEHLRVAILLGAFSGLRIAEVSELRVRNVDFIRGIVHPKQQWKERPLKTKASDAPIPIPHELTLMLSASVEKWPGDHMVCDEFGKPVSPWTLGRHVREVKSGIKDLPESFSFHDLRHYYASLLISKGADIKTVQARMRHGSAMTTLSYYAHLWPDADESTRTVIGGALKDRLETTAYPLRTEGPSAATG
ncbi:tyrosine-type recombinase/integrase [Nocardia terpenica]|uniref:Integrase n=1 Tax=Nocardia terpenica TaxID=455432 RepID=A0A164JXP7_9NOCA|nr:site-specific integrase [Nocardia terpenica]KZM70825.1 integrase [Nocardia terpenica]NQE89901.1 site-specific integrase [Nocardia terpenica]